MGISYSIDSSNKTVITQWSGTVTRYDMIKHWESVLSDSKALECGRSIVDLGESQLEVYFADLSYFMKNTVMPSLKEHKWKTGIITHNPNQLGVANQFMALAET